MLREKYNPGYMQAVWDNELGGRYSQALDEHEGDFWFYYHNFIAFQFSLWYWLIPCGIVLGCTIKNDPIRNSTFFSLIAGITYWLIISCSKTKGGQYDVPLYPFLALIGGITIYWPFSMLKNSSYITQQFKINVVPYVFLFFVFLTPYKTIIDKVYRPKEYDGEKEFYSMSSYLQGAIKGKHDVSNRLLCNNGYHAHLLFYVNILNDTGKQINFADWHSLKNGNIVIAFQEEIKNYIAQNYSYDIVEGYYNIITYKIRGPVTTNN
jgi:hypothetical protein